MHDTVVTLTGTASSKHSRNVELNRQNTMQQPSFQHHLFKIYHLPLSCSLSFIFLQYYCLVFPIFKSSIVLDVSYLQISCSFIQEVALDLLKDTEDTDDSKMPLFEE